MDHLYYNLKCYNIRYLYKSEFKFYLIKYSYKQGNK